jgi:hypothetical protein
MAVSVQNANLVRQKAYNAVYSPLGSSTSAVSPYHFYAIKAFFLHWAANKGNLDLQFIPYSAEQAVTNPGVDLTTGAGTLYVWYAKARRTTGTTASFQALHDAADNALTTTTVATQKINAVGQQFILVHPNGVAFATSLTISAATAVGGATESSAADATDGFVIVGA